MEESKTTYDSVLAAKYLLGIAYSKDIVLNVTKVQKLLYMAFGYFLFKEDRVLLSESPKAWPYGPVFPRTRKKVNFTQIISLDSDEFSELKKDENVTKFFNLLVDKYAKYTASQLSEWSHIKDGPWDVTTKQSGFKWNSSIPNELMSEYFSNINF